MAEFMMPNLKKWMGEIPVLMVHHVHVLVKDVEAIQKFLEGMPGIDSMQLHDVRRFNGSLALMVRMKPVSVEFIQIVDPEVGNARLFKDDPLGLNTIDFLVADEAAAKEAAQNAGFIIMGEMMIYQCKEIWLRHPELPGMNIEFMVMPPRDYQPGLDPEKDRAKVWIYGRNGDENLYFE